MGSAAEVVPSPSERYVVVVFRLASVDTRAHHGRAEPAMAWCQTHRRRQPSRWGFRSPREGAWFSEAGHSWPGSGSNDSAEIQAVLYCVMAL
jgi:hypothetical protein